jgi:peptidoglycan hydrolase-like protein with peptidoglycan-binding domain
MGAQKLERKLLVAIVAVVTVACGIAAFTSRGSGGSSSQGATGNIVTVEPDGGVSDAAGAATPADGGAAAGSDGTISVGTPDELAATDTTATDTAATNTVPEDPTTLDSAASAGEDLDGTPALGEGCRTRGETLRVGSSGDAVSCLQTALSNAGFYTGSISGSYDDATAVAVKALQTERKLYVDGVAGRESGLSLGIWPDEAAMVVHTPKPASGAKDTMGYRLSSVAVSGNDPAMPALPDNSGSGRRLVYERIAQRVWAVGSDGKVVRSWLVSGSQYNNEVPGTYQVYSKSNPSTAWNGKAILPKMVRYQKTTRGNIGFHGIPIHVEDGSPYMTDAELGTRLSGGCQRQADLDADFTWDFADVGTTVVVL